MSKRNRIAGFAILGITAASTGIVVATLIDEIRSLQEKLDRLEFDRNIHKSLSKSYCDDYFAATNALKEDYPKIYIEVIKKVHQKD